MIRHLLKLVWNRKRANGLIMLEMFVSFLVLFALTTYAVFLANAYNRPLGFDWQNVWNVTLEVDAQQRKWLSENRHIIAGMLDEVRRMDEVEVAAGAQYIPYDRSISIHSREIDGRRVEVQLGQATDELLDVMRLQVVQGRWFEPADAALGYLPVAIDRELARDLFGDEDPLGRELAFGPQDKPRRVVGVIGDYRKEGEFSGPGNFMFYRREIEDTIEQPLLDFLVRVHPGTTAEFERTVSERLRAMAPGINVGVQPIERMRETALLAWIVPLIGGGILAGFLLLMVALGLIGVLWQNVTQRTREIGLRRAAGAAESSIHVQIVTEVLLITAISLALGTVTVLQLPLFDQIQVVPVGVFLMSLALTIVLMLLFTGGCALYPSWMATRIQPAEALHYE